MVEKYSDNPVSLNLGQCFPILNFYRGLLTGHLALFKKGYLPNTLNKPTCLIHLLSGIQ